MQKFRSCSSSFLFVFFCFLLSSPSRITQKLYNALLSESFLFWVRAACKLRLASYGSKCAPQFLSLRYFVHTYMHNSKSKGHIRTFYLSSDCSATRDGHFLVRAVWKLRLANYGSKHITVSSQYHILCALTLITRKLQDVYKHSTYWMTALLSEMTIFWVRAGCGIRLVSYGLKHVLQSLFNVTFCTHLHNLKTTHVWTFRILKNSSTPWEIPCVVYAIAWEIQVDSYCPRHALGGSLIQHCMHMLQAHSYIPIWWQLCMTTNSHTLWLDTTN